MNKQTLSSPTAGCHMLSVCFFLLLNQSPSTKKGLQKKKNLSNNYPSSSLRVAVFYTTIASQVLDVAITSVSEQITSEEKAQVERRNISFEATWTIWFYILIYTWRGRGRKTKVFILKQL